MMRRLALMLLILALPFRSFAAFNAGTGWEVRTTGSDGNGGGFAGGASTLATPSAPTVAAPTTGGTVAANTYYVVVAYIDAYGNVGPKSTQTTQVTTGTTSVINTTSPAASTGAVSYGVWMTTTSGGPYWPSPGTAVAIGTNSSRTTTPATSGTQPPGADLSQADAATQSYTDLTIDTTTTIHSAAQRTFVPADVGNVINITAGTNWTVQRVQITAVSATGVATLDKTIGASASGTGTGALGGGLLTLTTVEPLAIAGNTIYVKGGTYSETLTLTISGDAGTPRSWIGYNSTRGDAPTGTSRPLIDGASTRANCISGVATQANFFYHIRGDASTGAVFEQTTGNAHYVNCKASNSTGGQGWKQTSGAFVLVDCEASGNAGAGITLTTGSITVHGSYVHDNTGSGLTSTSGTSTWIITNTIVETNAATGIQVNNSGLGIFVGNTIYGNSGASSDGLASTAAGVNASRAFVMNCIMALNGRYGINRGTTAANFVADNNAYNSNSTSAYNNVTAGAHDVTTAPGFTNAGGGDFSIGTNYKALGFPGVFQGGLSTGYMDIGAVQRQEAGGSGGIMKPLGLRGGIVQ